MRWACPLDLPMLSLAVFFNLPLSGAIAIVYELVFIEPDCTMDGTRVIPDSVDFDTRVIT